jgi:flagellar motility protein MotE (MotC chaperone)
VADPMEDYFKYRFPKDEIDESEDYKNWHIYKQKMYNDQMQEIDDKEEKLKLLEENLKTNYFTLLGRKDQRLNSSTSYATLKKQS